MEGPRAVRKGKLASLRALTDIVFRPGLMDEYPQLFELLALLGARDLLRCGKIMNTKVWHRQ